DLHDWVATSFIGKLLHLSPILTHWMGKMVFGFIIVSGFYLVGGLFFHWLMTVDFRRVRPGSWFPKKPLEEKLLARTTLLQYLTFQFFAISVLLAMPVKLILRLAL